LVVAVPVAPPETLIDLRNIAEQVVVPFTPDPFIAIGRFYENFDQVSDTQVKNIMKTGNFRSYYSGASRYWDT
jgi:putative phosphoribosyl transferase